MKIKEWYCTKLKIADEPFYQGYSEDDSLYFSIVDWSGQRDPPIYLSVYQRTKHRNNFAYRFSYDKDFNTIDEAYDYIERL